MVLVCRSPRLVDPRVGLQGLGAVSGAANVLYMVNAKCVNDA